MSIRNRIREGSTFGHLHRYPSQGWLSGVCVGLAEFFDWNVKLVRVLFVAAFIISGFFPVGLIYLGLWYLMDDADSAPAARSERPRYREAPASAYASRSTPPRSSEDVKARFSRLEERLRNMEACVTSEEFELRRELRKLES
ncbi:MAG TPA: envelope stress response membrane protein PspC [Fontimonas sp.]